MGRLFCGFLDADGVCSGSDACLPPFQEAPTGKCHKTWGGRKFQKLWFRSWLKWHYGIEVQARVTDFEDPIFARLWSSRLHWTSLGASWCISSPAWHPWPGETRLHRWISTTRWPIWLVVAPGRAFQP